MGIFVFAFTATGKSNVAKKYKNVIDMESTLYKYIGNDLEDESLKSTSRFLNEEWPENYFNFKFGSISSKYSLLFNFIFFDAHLSSSHLSIHSSHNSEYQ